MERRYVLSCCGTAFVAAAGCVTGFSGKDRKKNPDNETGTPSDMTPTTERPNERNASPNQYIRVTEVQNRSAVATAPENQTSTFENLSDDRQQDFLKAVEDGTAPGFDWDFADPEPRYVRYNDTWYRVLVVTH